MSNSGGVRVIPDVLNFGNVPAGEHFDREFTVGNEEPNAITVTFPRLEPEPHEGGALFWEPGNIVIPPGRHETVSLQFFPRETGLFQATLRFTSNGPGSPHSIRVRGRVS